MSRASSPLGGRMVFAFGARRSGTYWLHRVITAHPRVGSVPSETHLFSHGIAPLFERFQHSLRSSTQVGAVYVDREVALDAVRDLCDAVFAGFLEGHDYLCERTPLHALHTDLIRAVYPDARIVHIIRDGRDVARSLAVQDFGPQSVADAAAEWRDTVRAGRRAGPPGKRYLELRYEDLHADPEPVLRELYGWLGLEVSDQVLAGALAEARTVRNVDRFRQPDAGTEKWRSEFSRPDLAAFNDTAGELLAELGYRIVHPSELPRRPASAARGARRIRLRIARAAAAVRSSLRRPGLASVPRLAGPARGAARQQRVDRLVAALGEGDRASLSRLLTPDALVRVVGPRGQQDEARGDAGVELASSRLTGDDGFRGRQLRGDVFPSRPNFGVVLVAERPDGSLAHRVLFCELRDERFASVTVYQLESAPDGAG